MRRSVMSPKESAMIHRWTVKTLGVCALLSCAMGSGLSQTHPEPYTFFSQYIDLRDDQIASIDQGKAVAQELPTPAPSEGVVFGAIYIAASSGNYLRVAQGLDSLRGLPNYLGIRQFGAPPKLSDFEGFVLEDDDIKDLKSCRP
ncbi:MAG: hypothetical protein ACLQVM_12430 [Terriglobia bacterium]